MKETGEAHWKSPLSATNSSGFTGLPGGYRGYNSSFNYSVTGGVLRTTHRRLVPPVLRSACIQLRLL
jgi:hypothetical protein